MDERCLVRGQLPAGTHFGELRELQDFGGLLLAQSDYSPCLVTGKHSHETASFAVTLKGGYSEEHRKQSFDCLPGKILFRNEAERHINCIGPTGASCAILEMRPGWRKQMDIEELRVPVYQVPDTICIALRVRQELEILDDATPLAIEALVLELFSHLQRNWVALRRVPTWLKWTREKLEAEFLQKHSLPVLAREAGVHPSHLARAFRQHFGCSLGEYKRRRRIAFACERIIAGDPLSEVAGSCGFSSQPHLSRTFKTITGMSPGAFQHLKCTTKAKKCSESGRRLYRRSLD